MTVLIDKKTSLPSMFKMNAGYFLVQVASETDREKVQEPRPHVKFHGQANIGIYIGVQTLRRTFSGRCRRCPTGKADHSNQ